MTDEPFALDPSEADPTPEPGEDFEADVGALVRAIRAYLNSKPDAVTLKNLEDAIDIVDEYFQDNGDPRSMGWIDDKGRP